MGTNIYVHTELKVRGKWLHWEQLHIDRDYELFATMGLGDFPEAPPVAPIRGLPEDVTETTAWDFSLCAADNHSPSWLSAPEADRVTAWFNENRPKKNYLGVIFREQYPGPDTIRELHKNSWLVESGLENARVVFWFRG